MESLRNIVQKCIVKIVLESLSLCLEGCSVSSEKDCGKNCSEEFQLKPEKGEKRWPNYPVKIISNSLGYIICPDGCSVSTKKDCAKLVLKSRNLCKESLRNIAQKCIVKNRFRELKFMSRRMRCF